MEEDGGELKPLGEAVLCVLVRVCVWARVCVSVCVCVGGGASSLVTYALHVPIRFSARGKGRECL